MSIGGRQDTEGRVCFAPATPGVRERSASTYGIRLISGLLGFAATRETVIDEIRGAWCPSCKKADFHEYCKRPTTRKGDTQRYQCNACGHKFSEALEFGPTWYSPEMIMQSLSMYCRGMSTRQIRDHWREARQSEDEKYPSHATVSLWAKRYLTMIVEYIAQFTPDVSDIWSTDEMYILVSFNGAVSIADRTRKAKESAGKIPEVALRDGGANLNLAISPVEETASGRKETQQVYAHLTGNPTNLAGKGRTLGERLRVPGFIKGTTASWWPASSRSTTGGTWGWAATPPQRRRASS